MKELDFDELDRAVNSLMSTPGSSSPSAAEPEPTEKVVDVSRTASTSPVSLPVQTPPSSSQASLPSRRGGRFMDVVHPSSDMKKPEQPRVPSRQGVTIAPRPTFDATKEEPVSEKAPESPVPKLSDKIDASSPSSPEIKSTSNEWPDPLDMAGFTHEPSTETIKNQDKPIEEVKEDTPAEPEVPVPSSDPAPLTSPFLPDAKVEKRPLGGSEPAVEEPGRAPTAPTIQEIAADPNDQLPALPKDVEPILPEELHSDLVQVESDTTAAGIPKTEDVSAGVSEESKEKPITSLPPEPPTSEKDSVPTGPTSIPQQYREEPSSGDKDNGAIYDTDAYHQPLAHPAKKKSGMMVVLWIVIILLVGAGIGAALYFLGVF